MSTILVVGGAGYVGSVLASELLERGYDVTIFDRLYYGAAGLDGIRDRVRCIPGDMRCLPPELLEGVSAVVNVGGLSNDPTAEYNPKANHEMNTEAALALAEACLRRGVRRYVFASSCSIYDVGVGVTNEDRDVLQDETAPVQPRAAYSLSKWEAECRLLDLAAQQEDFCPIILRKGTVYGFSARMRYDLVVNTFVKDGLSRGRLTLHHGGELWRPLVDVRDVARAYILCLEAAESQVRGEIFNVAYRNMRISEVALRVRQALAELGVKVEIEPDYGYRAARSYRVSTAKIRRELGFEPRVSIEESVQDMVQQVRTRGYEDFENPRYYNIRWMRALEEANQVIAVTGSVFGVPASPGG